jgi:hypothetical protein
MALGIYSRMGLVPDEGLQESFQTTADAPRAGVLFRDAVQRQAQAALASM